MNELGGCINGDDTMYYLTPDKKYNFKIYRTENNNLSEQFFCYSMYIITIEVYDGIIGNPIMKMNFDQFVCLDILYNMAVSLDILINVQDSNAIYINPDNSNLSGYMIQLTAIYGTNPIDCFSNNSPMFYLNQQKEYDKDVRLDIFERSYIYDNLVPMVTVDLTWEELADFAFHVFFGVIIDLEFPEEMSDKLEAIELFVSNNELYALYALKARNQI